MRRKIKISRKKLPYLSLIYGTFFGLIGSILLLFFIFYNGGDLILISIYSWRYYFIAPTIIFMLSLWFAGKYLSKENFINNNLYLMSLKYATISLTPPILIIFFCSASYFDELVILFFLLSLLIFIISILIFSLLPWISFLFVKRYKIYD